MRRKSLAELFKALQDLGLSFRRGLIHLKSLDGETDFYDFTTEPADLSEGWRNLDEHLSSKFPADLELIEAWNGCETYFQKCISRIALLLKSFHSPSKELGPHILDRCKGYVIDLLQRVSEEKQAIGKYGKLLWNLRTLVSLPNPDKDKHELVPDTFSRKLYNGLCELETEYCQYRLVADSLDEENYTGHKSSLNTLCEAVISRITSIKGKLRVSLGTIHVQHLSEGLIDRAILVESVSCVHELLKIIENSQGRFVSSSILWKSLDKSKSRWTSWLDQFWKVVEASSEEFSSEKEAMSLEGLSSYKEVMSSEEFSPSVQKVLESILLSFQRLDTVKNDQVLGDTEKFNFLLPFKRVNSFDIDCILNNVVNIKRVLATSRGEEYENGAAILGALTPLIFQFSFTLQFYLKFLTKQHRATAKLLSVLSGLFGTLGQKGFCLPKDYENDAVEESQEIDEKSGMGLGEGETTSDAQDVSDRLESEDQLDDTMKAGEAAETADKDVAQDDKGIEMSEDFGGKQQEMDKKKEEEEENENSDDENKMEDVEQEMGDVDATGEKLDDKVKKLNEAR